MDLFLAPSQTICFMCKPSENLNAVKSSSGEFTLIIQMGLRKDRCHGGPHVWKTFCMFVSGCQRRLKNLEIKSVLNKHHPCMLFGYFVHVLAH